MSAIHPAAHIDPTAQLAPDVRVGPGAVVGPRCSLAEGCVLHPGAYVLRDATLGERVEVYPGAVVGGAPQDLKFDDSQPAGVEIGAGTVIRENATVSLGTLDPQPTRVGASCMLMEGAHVGHNSQLADHVIIANSAKLAGHVRVGERCFISALALVHQFVDIGELCMFQGYAGVSMHIPPFVLVGAGANAGVVGLNRVGLKRSGLYKADDLAQIKDCFKRYYRGRDRAGWASDEALAEMRELATLPGAERFVGFIEAALAQVAPRARGVIGPAG